MLFSLILITIVGLVFGSFLGAFTYRLPRAISIAKGRSFCPRCKATIAWFDNIPLLSYFLLAGRCRSCKKKIGIREPLIEASLGFLFLLTFLRLPSIFGEYAPSGLSPLVFLFFILFVISIFFALLIIDWEEEVLPDALIFLGLGFVFVFKLLTFAPNLYMSLLAGFIAGSFLLLLHLLTKGRGMGLGDVKFALLGGTFLGFPNVIAWLLGSFFLGALVGIFLILGKQKKMKDAIAFGPFLVFAFFLVLFFPQLVESFIQILVR